MVSFLLNAHRQPAAPAGKDWSPRDPVPSCLLLENLRKLGIDEIRLRQRSSIPGGPVALLLIAVVVAGAGYLASGHSHLVAGALGLCSIGVVATSVCSASRWSLSILPGKLILAARRGWLPSLRRSRIEFSSIESISIATASNTSIKALVIHTTTTSQQFAAGIGDEALIWLKNYLIMEFAGLTWRPIAKGDSGSAGYSDCGESNPVMLKPDLAMRLIDLYLEQAPANLKELRTAVVMSDATAIRQHAHWLKSASANVGAHHLSELCQLMEMYAVDDDLSQCPILCREIEAKYPGIETWLSDIKGNAARKLVTSLPSRNAVQGISIGKSKSDRVQRKIVEARILVVDDSALSREIGRELLSSLVSIVEFANDGKVAVEMWREGGYDLIFMDCEMIGMNGFEATRQIRQEALARGVDRTPIIALTGHVLQDCRDQCYAAGMDDYLGKPYRPPELQLLLDKWLPAGRGIAAAPQ